MDGKPRRTKPFSTGEEKSVSWADIEAGYHLGTRQAYLFEVKRCLSVKEEKF